MSTPERLFDVYISYPPGIDHRQVDSTIRQHLTEEEADEVIRALEEHPQAIIAERCTNEERLNAQNYFGYLGLDVIIRLSLELMEDPDEEKPDKPAELVPQCPVCSTIFEDPDTTECPTCHIHLKTATEAFIYRKRIEWQERLAFEHRKQHEIAYRMLREKQAEERKIRNQIRNELETELLQELGILNGWQSVLYNRRVLVITLAVSALVLVFFAAGYLLARLLA